MREKSLMSRKEAKQEAEMRNSVSDLPSELATTQEEQEVMQPEEGDRRAVFKFWFPLFRWGTLCRLCRSRWATVRFLCTQPRNSSSATAVQETLPWMVPPTRAPPVPPARCPPPLRNPRRQDHLRLPTPLSQTDTTGLSRPRILPASTSLRHPPPPPPRPRHPHPCNRNRSRSRCRRRWRR